MNINSLPAPLTGLLFLIVTALVLCVIPGLVLVVILFGPAAFVLWSLWAIGYAVGKLQSSPSEKYSAILVLILGATCLAFSGTIFFIMLSGDIGLKM